MPPKLTKEIFANRANKIHRNFYNYSKVVYKNSMTKVEIICPEHGSFWQKPNTHLFNHGCPLCKPNAKTTLKNFYNIVKKAQKGYSYPNLEKYFVGGKTILNIVCPTHGLFKQKAALHLNGSGCPACAKVKPLTKRIFVERAKTKHYDKYNYTRVIYKNTRTKVEIICPEHGSFWQTPRDHMCGSGCPDCSAGGINFKKKAWLYYFQDKITKLYKIGITNKSEINKRFPVSFRQRIKMVHVWFFKTGKEAYDREQYLHKKYKKCRVLNYKWINGSDINGATEFFSEDVLGLDLLLLPRIEIQQQNWICKKDTNGH